MGVSLYKIKKWIKMLTGKSISHVEQGIGRVFSSESVQGYYNDLTEKVTRRNLTGKELPMSSVDTGEKMFFSIEIFQYGLGAYDLYLLNDDKSMIEKIVACADWAIENQQADGSWITFAYKKIEYPYSSMAQGEGISLLIRAHIITGDDKYLLAAHKAKDFMLIPMKDGGTTSYIGDDVYFYESTQDPLILNGWIFSLWGLYDYCKYFNDAETKRVLEATLLSLKKKLPDFDMKYWSKYEDGQRICSPFYHKLHIAQLRVMYDLTGDSVYSEYVEKWEKYLKSFWNPKRAFLKKFLQKIFE